MFKKAMLVAVGMVLVSGCAAMRANAARQASLQNSLSNYTMTTQPDQVLNMARMVLVERGFTPSDVSANIIETDWKHSSSSSYGSSSSSSATWKYVVTAMVVGDGTRLVVMRNSQQSSSGTTSSNSTPSSTRDYDLELEILRKLDPTTASGFESEAERSAQLAAENG